MKKIALFVDVQNIYYTTRDRYKRSFNYKTLWQHFAQQGSIDYAYAYAIDRGIDSQIKFQDALRNIGFEIKLKPFIQRQDGTAKGDWDVGITIDILECAAHVDEVILLSGDGDFAILLDHIKHKYGVRTRVFGVEFLTSNQLIQSCDEFTDIDAKWLL
ncbi:NYN domain-containing protein [Bermanella sp. R86510]|uniref:LabA-like NYN domain-containing protein n=1 Tax=unclassified Bermanella TaxID=2627862 RepID=UPI0037CBDECC